MEKDSFYRKLNTSELLTLIVTKYHSSLRSNNPKILKDLKHLSVKYKHKETKIGLVYDLFIQFDDLIIKHIEKEEKVFFKSIRELEKTIEVCKNINPNSIDECKLFLNTQKEEHNEIDQIVISINELTLELKAIKDPRYYEFLHKINLIMSETKDHAKIEDFYLDEKISFYLSLI